MKTPEKKRAFKAGLADGLPIGLGYISVSFTFGMMAVTKGMSPIAAILISFTNLTSAGQFAGLDIIAANGTFIEMALVELVINLRYGLMSLSWTQKLSPEFTTLKRLLIAYADTDEVFAVSASRATGGKKLTFAYMTGLILLPIIGWTLGTVLGALASSLLPAFIRSALGIAIYGMFIAIIVPPARDDKAVRVVVLTAVGLSLMIHYLPVLKNISSGFAIIICGVGASLLGAKFFPVSDDEMADENLESEDVL